MTTRLRLKEQIFRLYSKATLVPLNPILKYEWSRRDQRTLNERSIEYGFALRCLSKLTPRTVLDVGSGTTAWPRLLADCGYRVTAIDEGKPYWGHQPLNRHYHVIRDDITKPVLRAKFDAITCLSVLEHIEDHDTAMHGVRRLLHAGGHAIVSFPYNERTFVENVYSLPGVSYGSDLPYVCRVFSRSEVDTWLTIGFDVVCQEYHRIFAGDLWAFGERLRPPVETAADELHHLTCILLRAT